MASSTAEIVARLTLNGTAFSSENARIFSQMEASARDTAARTKSAFETSYNEIQQIAQRALATPRTAGGNFDLNVKGAREAAAAADAEAAALRQVASAAEALAIKTGDISESTRVYLQAARAAAIESENNARGLHQQANALDLLQQELNQTRASTDVVVQGNRLLNQSMDRGVTSSRGHAMAMTQASQQVQDFFIQVGGGQRVMAAFAMQASQMAFVLQNVGGQAGKFATYLSGGWGTAILGGLTLVGLFGDKLFGAGDALEAATAELEKNSRQTEITREAQERFKITTEGLIEASRELEDQTKHMNETSREATQRAIDDAKATLEQTKITRENTKALIENRIERMKAAMAQVGQGQPSYYGAGGRVLVADAAVREAEERLRQLDEAIDKDVASIAELEIGKARRDAAASTDAARRANEDYLDSIERIQQAYRNSKKTDADKLAMTQALTRAEADHKKAVDAANEAERKSRQKPHYGRDIAEQNRERLSEEAAKYRGLSEHGDKGTLQALFREANLNIDPEIVKWCAAFVNAVLATQGLKGTGALNARSFLSYGENTDSPTRGDIVVLRRGKNPDEGHVGFFEGFDRKGNVRVLGGNTSDKVDTATFPARDVLGFRRAPTAAQEATQQNRELEQQAELIERIHHALVENLDVQEAGLKSAAMRAQGLEREADSEAAIAALRKQHADQIAKLPDEQRVVSAELQAQLSTLEGQSRALDQLIIAQGDTTTLTDQEKAARAEALNQLLATVDSAQDMVKTDADRLQLIEAILRATIGIRNAQEDGAEAERKANKERADAARFMEQQEDAWNEYLRWQGDRAREEFESLAGFWEDAFRSGGKSIWEDFEDMGFRVLGQLAAQWTMQLLSGQKLTMPTNILQQMGATAGGGPLGFLSGLFGGGMWGTPGNAGYGDITGMVNNPANESIFGPALGIAAGDGANGLGSMAGGLGGIAGSLGQAMPYVGMAMAAGSLLNKIFGIDDPTGGLLGPLGALAVNAIKGTKRGSATLGFDQWGSLGVTSTRGNSGKREEAASGAIGSVADALKRIADALGGELTGTPSVSIGLRKDNWRVDPTGQGRTKTSKGAIDFGKDQEAAIRYAIQDALQDGVISGISAASKKILASGQDLERAIEKAAMIEEIPKKLAARLDPVGAALDELNERWEKTVAALKEGGATQQQWADAQKLYKIELEEVKERTREASADLKDFLKDLNFGSASPLSLRDQEAAAKAALQPFLAKIDAKETIDQGQYLQAAQAYLDIERQLGGSTGSFFSEMAKIQDYTNRAISNIDNATPIRTAADPFAERTANNTGTANDLLDRIHGRLGGIQDLLERMGGSGANGFIGGSIRAFAGRQAAG
jgi:uncharacterized protein (TIGR02594 family)